MNWTPRPSRVFFLGLFGALTIPRMAQPGMFLDGITYAVLARNFAAGDGTFWHPFYTATVYPRFHEQPPLGFALEAVAFLIAGDHLFVERTFALVMGLVTLGLTVALWRQTFGDRDHDWLPVLFWILPSTVTWALINNMLENTQAMLTTAAVLMCVRALRDGPHAPAWALGAGTMVAAAVLVKGPTGLFPLAAPAVAAVTIGGSGRAALRTAAAMLFATAAVGLGVFVTPQAREALTEYWHQHLGAAIAGGRGGGRLAAAAALLRHLAGGVLLRMGAMLGLVWLAAAALRIRRTPLAPAERGWTSFYLLMGIAASVPVLASTKIVGHYLVPSIPLFALGFAGVARPWVAPLQHRFSMKPAASRALGAAGWTLLALTALLPFLPLAIEPRDVKWIAEYRTIGPALQRRTIIGTCAAVSGDWGLHAYMQRLFAVSLDSTADRHAQYLQLKDRECAPPTGCDSVVETERLNLYACGAR